MRGCRSSSSLLIPAELEGRALELATEVPGWRSEIKQQSHGYTKVGITYNSYLCENHLKSYRFLNQSFCLVNSSILSFLMWSPFWYLSHLPSPTSWGGERLSFPFQKQNWSSTPFPHQFTVTLCRVIETFYCFYLLPFYTVLFTLFYLHCLLPHTLVFTIRVKINEGGCGYSNWNVRGKKAIRGEALHI